MFDAWEVSPPQGLGYIKLFTSSLINYLHFLKEALFEDVRPQIQWICNILGVCPHDQSVPTKLQFQLFKSCI
ncbi:hypothetical protein DICVIV_14083 [Dictyocaulus viviparus]|uniref:Uncharacterized protein n=1 Tax=Dictyocaulus viviparus TaxID=29172 RepID=A0A0D8X8P1_DICVI|nr:hypothetical protein DICVIV_14083 [Dictyocaulus viviparus]